MFTHEEVISRLEEAGRALLSLPPERAVGHCRTSIWEYVREPVHSMALPRKFEPTPSAKAGCMSAGRVIDMAGRSINDWFVVERAYGVGAGTSKAKWWVSCPACGEQHYETGSKLRAAEQNRWIIWCRACGLNGVKK